MNTLLLLPALFATDGGIERILRLYVKAVGELTPPGGRIDIVILNDTTTTRRQIIPFASPALMSAPIVCGRNRLACAWHVLRLARRADRVICGHVNLLRLARLAQCFSRRLEVWLVAHGIEVWRAFTPGEQRALRAATGILCVSEYTRRQLTHHCPGLNPARLHVQPNALDPKFENDGAHVDTATPGAILTVSRLSQSDAYKGIDDLIRAMPAIRQSVPEAHLKIVGDGDDRTRLETLARQVAPADAVEFSGRIDDAALGEAFSTCQLFALPSRSEGFGLVYLEAMAHGKPCVAVAAGAAPEVVDGRSGLIAEPSDVADLAATCIAALNRPWDPLAIRARARDFSYPQFKTRLSHALAA
ncbi:MAG: glycosyltransferase family 4 protein [Verrucomicrobiota bacterium]